MSLALRLVVIALALGGAFIPLPATWIERVYSSAVFPRLQSIVTRASNLVSFSLLDALLIAVVVWWMASGVRDIARGRQERGGPRPRALLSITMRTLTLGAVAYLGFLALWGLNYRRVPLDEKIAFDRTRVTSVRAAGLLTRAVDRLNALHDEAHRQIWTRTDRSDPALVRAFAEARSVIGASPRTVPGRPKTSLLDWYFRRAAVAGMTDPYFLETLLASDLLLVERPYVEAHEWAHLAGFAEESEASFVGWVTCLRGTPFHQYSAWLFLYQEIATDVSPVRFRSASSRLGEGPRADLAAIHARREAHVNPQVSAASWRVYDQYLKANHVEAGSASYGEIVTLILGTSDQEIW